MLMILCWLSTSLISSIDEEIFVLSLAWEDCAQIFINANKKNRSPHSGIPKVIWGVSSLIFLSFYVRILVGDVAFVIPRKGR
jgi:hypothetical protein